MRAREPAVPDAGDREQEAAVRRMPPGVPAEAVAARLRRRFGAERAWSAEAVARFRLVHAPLLARGRIKRHPQLRAFVDARVGAMTLDAIAREMRERFGDGVPSRSALQRYIARARRRAVAEAGR
jgi:hypothetical protein